MRYQSPLFMNLMHRSRWSLGFFLCWALAGCNQVLGIEDHELASGASGKGTSGGASGRAQGTGGQAGGGRGGSGGSGAGTAGSGGATGGSVGGTQATAGGTAGQQSVGGTSGSGAVEQMGGAAGDAGGGGNPLPGPVCGNGEIDGTDVCDDGNTNPGDGCSPTCEVEEGFTCDALGCSEICGDGLVRGLEAAAGGCDDNNTVADDGCTACTVDPAWVCAGEPSSCAKTCGDGKLQGSEQCDDGNMMQGDGCYACIFEGGFTCDTGATPTTCTDIDECASGGGSNCSATAICANTIGSFTCTCKNGYSGDGVTCTDTNECASGGGNNCSANANCTNNAGSFSCACKNGYTGDGVTCTDVNECASGGGNNCSANATCANTTGSFTCTCKNGYSGDGVTCSDVNECASGGGNNCSANATCANTTGSFTCTCKPTYMGDGVTCNPCNCTGGYSCTSTACKTTCSSDSDCVTDRFCSGTTCRSDATQVSISMTHACMVLADGTVRCWGLNTDRELGTSSTSNATTPQQVQSISTAKVVGAGYTQSVALLANGSVVYWGKHATSYDYSTFTTGYTTKTTPTTITGLSTSTDVVVSPNGDGATCTRVNDNTVRCWGFTAAYNGGTNFLDAPTDIGLTGVNGLSSGNSFNCAGLSAGGVKCWGYGSESELGASVNWAAPPGVASGVSGTISKIRSGDYFTCVLLTTGTVQCWGANQNHTLGPAGGSDFSNLNPLTVTGLSSVKDLAAGYANACALDTSGGIKCWGDDSYGQLGDGNQNPGSGAPVSVTGLAGPASSVAAGFQNACAVLQNGSVQCWGRSIGDLSSAVTLTPTTVW